MMRRKRMRWALFSVALAMLAVACSDSSTDTTDAAATTAAPTTTVQATTTTPAEVTTTAAPSTTAAPQGPETLGIAMLMADPIDNPWNRTQADALLRLQEASPYGLDVTVDFFENIDYADAERVIGDLAASGKYGIIHSGSTFADATEPWLDDYPDIAFAYAGAGNTGFGGNAYWIDLYLHECSYLAGVVAGVMSETGQVGAVAGFPFPNVNNGLHGFIAGAQSMNPDIESSAAYIEAWFDPGKAIEAGRALIAAGADVLYAPSFGTIEAAEIQGVFAVGDYMDQEALAPEAVLTSALARWDGAIKDVVDAWWNHQVNGTAYDAPLEPIRKLLAEDGCDIAPLNDALVSDEAVAAVAEAREKILSGELVVEIVDEPVE